MSSTFSKLVSTSFTNSDNIIYMADQMKLASLLKDEMSRRNVSIRDFAKLVGVSHPTISDILNGDQPSFDTCKLLSPVLHLSTETIMRFGGLLDPVPEFANQISESLEEGCIVLSQMSEDKRRIAIAILRAMQESPGESPLTTQIKSVSYPSRKKPARNVLKDK